MSIVEVPFFLVFTEHAPCCAMRIDLAVRLHNNRLELRRLDGAEQDIDLVDEFVINDHVVPAVGRSLVECAELGGKLVRQERPIPLQSFGQRGQVFLAMCREKLLEQLSGGHGRCREFSFVSVESRSGGNGRCSDFSSVRVSRPFGPDDEMEESRGHGGSALSVLAGTVGLHQLLGNIERSWVQVHAARGLATTLGDLATFGSASSIQRLEAIGKRGTRSHEEGGRA